MPTNLQGPAIFLAQFAGAEAPFNTLDNICAWAADLGYKGVQTEFRTLVTDGRAKFVPVTAGVIGGLDIEVQGVAEGNPVISG